MNRFGHYGNAATKDDIGEWAGVSAGTVENSTKRVVVALLACHDEFVRRPTPLECEASKDFAQKKTCHAWRNGYLAADGTNIDIFQKPGHYGETYYSGKNSTYSFNLQVSFVLHPHTFHQLNLLKVINLLHNTRIVDYGVGHTGSVHDSAAFADTRYYREHQTLLQPGEWIWVDSAYPSTTWCVPPFKRPSGGQLDREQKRFNYRLSSIRIRAEHTMGLLKGRFQSLRELRIQVRDKEKHEWAVTWIRCCIILHNMIISIEGEDGDAGWRRSLIGEVESESDPDNVQGSNGTGDVRRVDHEEGHPGPAFRRELMNKLLQSHLYRTR